MERCTYRGYRIEPKRKRTNWHVLISPLRPDLPILSRAVLRTATLRKAEAVAEAKHCIDRALSDFRSG